MRKLELCSIVSTHFIVEDGANMFSRLVAMMLMAVVLSTFATAVEMPEVSFYLRGTEETSLMQEVNEITLHAVHHCRRMPHSLTHSLTAHLVFYLSL